ncbi:MAG: hypothetical protein IJX94_01790, partial [Clostridia bacterium]|nr:hypothetical protein [Clostridia bacterium]
RKATEGLFFGKKIAFFTIPPSFSCENATSLYTREALNLSVLFLLLTVVSKVYFVSSLSQREGLRWLFFCATKSAFPKERTEKALPSNVATQTSQ